MAVVDRTSSTFGETSVPCGTALIPWVLLKVVLLVPLLVTSLVLVPLCVRVCRGTILLQGARGRTLAPPYSSYHLTQPRNRLFLQKLETLLKLRFFSMQQAPGFLTTKQLSCSWVFRVRWVGWKKKSMI